MKKKKISELDHGTIERIVAMAREEKKPLQAIKNEFGYTDKEITDLIKSKFPADEYEMWKKKAGIKKSKPKMVNDDFDELDAKYYIKNKFD